MPGSGGDENLVCSRLFALTDYTCFLLYRTYSSLWTAALRMIVCNGLHRARQRVAFLGMGQRDVRFHVRYDGLVQDRGAYNGVECLPNALPSLILSPNEEQVAEMRNNTENLCMSPTYG